MGTWAQRAGSANLLRKSAQFFTSSSIARIFLNTSKLLNKWPMADCLSSGDIWAV